jgi:hypothetical protein
LIRAQGLSYFLSFILVSLFDLYQQQLRHLVQALRQGGPEDSIINAMATLMQKSEQNRDEVTTLLIAKNRECAELINRFVAKEGDIQTLKKENEKLKEDVLPPTHHRSSTFKFFCPPKYRLTHYGQVVELKAQAAERFSALEEAFAKLEGHASHGREVSAYWGAVTDKR